jgi:outer membrane protein assembly factor BamB
MKYINLLFVSATFLFIISCGGQKPEIPTVTGPLVMIPAVSDTFSTVTTDPNGDNIRYRFDWGNGTITDWSEALASGSTYKTTFAYTNRGQYYVKAQAKDQTGKASDWSESHKVICGLGMVIWSMPPDEEFDDEINSTPAIDDQGNIYAGCIEGHVHSFTANGSQRWRFEASYEVISSPAIASNGTIYACDRDGYVYALNSSNGTQLWSVNTGASDIIATPAIGRRDEIYINTADGLYAISAQGQIMWDLPDINGASSVAIDASNNLYVGTSDGYLFSFDTAGNTRWSYNVGGEIISSPAITSDGKICFGADDGYFYMLNSDSTLFRRTLIGTSISASPVIGTDGAIYITTDDGTLNKFSSDGTEEWFFTTDASFPSSPAVVRYTNTTDDIIYFKASWGKKKQADEDSLFMVKADGSEFAAGAIVQNSPDAITSSPMVGSDGTIYIGGGIDWDTDEGGLFALAGRGTVVSSSWPLFRQNRKNTGRSQ